MKVDDGKLRADVIRAQALARQYIRWYGSGMGLLNGKSHATAMSDLLVEIAQKPMPPEQEWDRWKAIAVPALEDIPPDAFCDGGNNQVRRARVLFGLPVTVKNVVIGRTISSLQLPPGQANLNPEDYLVTIKHKSGVVLLMDATADYADSEDYDDQDEDDDGDDDDDLEEDDEDLEDDLDLDDDDDDLDEEDGE